MARLIDRENACNMFNRFFSIAKTHEHDELVLDMKQAFLELPTVEVVRCKDCEYWENGKDYTPYCNHVYGMYGKAEENYFCSYGERKDNA